MIFEYYLYMYKYIGMKRLILLPLMLLLCSSVFAQEEKQDTVLPKGTISGRVMTEDGVAIPGADVFVYNIDDIVGSSTTDSAGNYLTNRMFPGTYRVWVKCKGYIRKSIDGVQVIVWKDTKLDIKLSLFKESGKADDALKPDAVKITAMPVGGK